MVDGDGHLVDQRFHRRNAPLKRRPLLHRRVRAQHRQHPVFFEHRHVEKHLCLPPLGPVGRRRVAHPPLDHLHHPAARHLRHHVLVADPPRLPARTAPLPREAAHHPRLARLFVHQRHHETAEQARDHDLVRQVVQHLFQIKRRQGHPADAVEHLQQPLFFF